MVNRLRHARALLTGKHHEVMAACVARCPFVTPAIATHKIAGLGDYAGVTLPRVEPGCGRAAVLEALERAAADADGTFARLFDRLEALRDERAPPRPDRTARLMHVVIVGNAPVTRDHAALVDGADLAVRFNVPATWDAGTGRRGGDRRRR